MIALGGPKLKPGSTSATGTSGSVSMIALGGPKLKHEALEAVARIVEVSMIALGGPKLKHEDRILHCQRAVGFNDSTGWA